MPVVPDKKTEKISFFENHTTLWTTNATAIGTTTTAVTDLVTKTTAARTAYNAQQVAQDAAKSATEAYDLTITAMASAGAAIISQVRTKAKTAGNSVYTLANIPAPATPSPIAAPGTPTDFKAVLDGNGALLLSWKCPNPGTGTMYQVYRALGASIDFQYQGGTGERKFVDNTIPAGTSRATYKVQAVRSTSAGMWATYNVLFGGVGTTVQVEEVLSGRKAA